jgi:two-component system NarL family sensor kinase
VASFIALWLGFHFRGEIPGTGWQKIAGAVVAGTAISSMHYTAMAAVRFIPSPAPINLAHTISLSTLSAIAIASATMIVQGAAMLTSFVDRRFAAQREELLASRMLLLQEEERRRIALDLHDVLGQDLTAAKLNLGRLEVYIGDERGQKLLSETEHLLANSINEVRTLSQALRPPDIESLGLRAALVVYAESFRERSGIEIKIDVPEKLPKLSGHAEATLLKVVQECLLNIQRHSGSKRVRIRVHVDLSQLILEVTDEGGGIKTETLDKIRSGASGVGIAGMHERLENLGGRLEVTSGPSGTTVKAILPIPGSRAL